jgi:hypothetical protein
MSGVESVPEASRIRAYDQGNATWVIVSATQSGEVIIGRGEVLHTNIPVVVTNASGGQPLGSGLTTSGSVVDRVIIKVPEAQSSGLSYFGEVRNSGRIHGVWVGGKSGDAPYPDASGEYLASGKGLYCPPGTQKELYVNGLDEIYLSADPSGYPVTYVAEGILL